MSTKVATGTPGCKQDPRAMFKTWCGLVPLIEMHPGQFDDAKACSWCALAIVLTAHRVVIEARRLGLVS